MNSDLVQKLKAENQELRQQLEADAEVCFSYKAQRYGIETFIMLNRRWEKHYVALILQNFYMLVALLRSI